MRRLRQPDPVNEETRRFVLRRDGQCVAHVIDERHVCRDQWGVPHRSDELGKMTLDHVKDAPRMGKRAPSDAAHLVTLCWGAHIRSGWATSHRPELREYLKEVT